MKKITRRNFLKITAASSVATALTACGTAASSSTVADGSENSAATSAEDGAEKINLKWVAWDLDAATHYDLLVDAYIAKNPNVTIELVDLGSTDYSVNLVTQLSGGADDLDIINIKDTPGYANLVSLGMLEELTAYTGEAGIDTSSFGGVVEQLSTESGEFYMLPYIKSFWLIYYNKDLFDKAGVEYPNNDMTFEDYDALARRATMGEGAEKVYGAHFHVWRSAVQLMGILDGKNSVFTDDYSFFAPSYEWVLAEQADGICMDYATLKTSQTHYSGVFYNQQIAMMNMGSWFIQTQIDKVKSGESLAVNWGLAKYPHAEGVEPGTTLGTVTALAVNSKSANKAAALDFVNFVSGPEGAAIIAETGNFPASMSDEAMSIITSVEGFPTDEASKEAIITAKTYLEMPMHEYAADISVALDAGHDNIMTLNATIEEGIAQMNEEVGAILAQ